MIPGDERKVSDQEFLNALNPARRDLQAIRRAGAEGDLDVAREMLVAHFRNRKNPRWFFDHRSGKNGPSVFASWDEGTGQHIDPLRHVDALLENRHA